MPNDNFTLDQFQRIAMTLSEILANRPQNRALARASDVPGADLQWMYTTAYPTGAWYGNLGELGTTAFRDALFTGCLALGVTCKVSGVPYSWGGAGVGWGGDVVLSINDAASIASAATATPVNFPIATIKANTIKDRENFSVSWLFASSGTSGGAFEIQLGGQPIIPTFYYGYNDSLYFTVVLSTLGTSTRRLRIFGNTYNTVVATLSIDMTQDLPVNIKITPGVGNSVSIQQFSIKRG